jgi:hypothetical protein
MARWLNSFLILLSCLVFSTHAFSQDDFERSSDKDYKDQDQFEKFYKRRKLIATWQVNQLKEGALVVKLKTNNLTINALTKAGNKAMAKKKTLEILAINLNITRAFRSIYTFSKVYFMYSNYTDSLLNGQRKNIFLDTNLVIDSNIEMNESFYLIAESDEVFNSSIGFVPEDSARFVSEHGSKSSTYAPIIIKNKYGHQLKRPFPYLYYGFPIAKPIYNETVLISGKSVPFNVMGNLFRDKITYPCEGKSMKLLIPEDFTYSRISYYVYSLNDNLKEFFQANPQINATELSLLKPFLY